MAISKRNWDIVRSHYDRGKTPTEISRIVAFNISRQAIEQKIQRDKWPPPSKPEIVEAAIVPLDIPKDMEPIKAAICAQVAAHGTLSLACKTLGVPERTFRDWRKKDPGFATVLDAAQAQATAPVVSKAYQAAKSDPKYSWKWLESHPSTREEFGRVETGTRIGTVKIGKLIQRGDNRPAVIDQD